VSRVRHVHLPGLLPERRHPLPPLRVKNNNAGTSQRVTKVDFTPLGLMVGHATDREGATGVTVVRHTQSRWRGGYCIVGRATGTRELNALSPTSLADRVDAVMLTGGSAFGLDAASGVMRWMEENRRGHPMGDFVVPIVPAAVIFDLLPLGRPDARPTPDMAYAACDSAQSVGFREGSVGAGTGATVGKVAGREGAMKGGVGCWFEQVGELMVGAVAVVNAFGDIRDANGVIIAGARVPDGSFVDSAKILAEGPPAFPAKPATTESPISGNTTLAVVATNATLSRSAISELAQAASAALYRRITPAGTSYDGDIVFSLCRHEGVNVPLVQVEALAVRTLEMAIERAVRLA
jgi:L-aminopeptidase/D-esterase-like protein